MLSKDKDFEIIIKDIKKNNISYANVYQDFFRGKSKQNLAFLVDTETADSLDAGDKFISEDYFFESMGAMMIRKDFCCKKLIDTFVHRLMSSGIYHKYYSDSIFLWKLPLLLKNAEEITSKRKLNLIDVAPAFIFLIMGYLISFFILIGEILISRRKKVKYFKNKRKMRKKKYYLRKVLCK